MAKPMLKSIQPVNLLSFGPKTEPIELGRLNILIGANGSGKSNFIEILRLIKSLPDKEPWSIVHASGGAEEWLWKGRGSQETKAKISLEFFLEKTFWEGGRGVPSPPSWPFLLDLEVEMWGGSFLVVREVVQPRGEAHEGLTNSGKFEREGSKATVLPSESGVNQQPVSFDLGLQQSVFAQLELASIQASGLWEPLYYIFEFFRGFDFHQNWHFGADSPVRDLLLVGQTAFRLEENGSNLAQMLAHYRDYHKPVFHRLTEYMQRFYEPVKSVEIRLISTSLQIAIEERGGYSIPAPRLSDGMLRWLSLLAILLNPNPAPVTCIDEPELGLHPDVIPTLADLLREASERTQLIVTTHSPALVDAFSDDPEAICVCEKEEASTVIRRLSKQELGVWLKEYSLGNLWTSGQIGGNRW